MFAVFAQKPPKVRGLNYICNWIRGKLLSMKLTGKTYEYKVRLTVITLNNCRCHCIFIQNPFRRLHNLCNRPEALA